MKIDVVLVDGVKVVRLDTERPVTPLDTPAALYLSVTTHVEDAKGTVHEQNTFVGISKEDLIPLVAVARAIMDDSTEEA